MKMKPPNYTYTYIKLLRTYMQHNPEKKRAEY